MHLHFSFSLLLLFFTALSHATELPRGYGCLGDPVSVRRTGNVTDLFVIAGDGKVYTSFLFPGFRTYSGWWPIEGFQSTPCAPIAAVSRSENHIDIFAVGTNRKIYTAAWEANNPGWKGWWQVSGFEAHDTRPFVSAVSRDTDKLDLFSVGTNSGVYTIGWQPESGWAANWQRISTFQASDSAEIAVVSRQPGLMDIFAPDKNGNIFTAAWTGTGWAGWWAVANGKTASKYGNVAAVSRSRDKLDVFTIGSDGRVWTAWWQPGFNGFAGWAAVGSKSFPGFPNAPPTTAVSQSTDVITLFAIGSNARVWTARWSPQTGWVDWQMIQGLRNLRQGRIGASSSTNGRLDVFAYGVAVFTGFVETWVQRRGDQGFCDMDSPTMPAQNGCTWY